MFMSFLRRSPTLYATYVPNTKSLPFCQFSLTKRQKSSVFMIYGLSIHIKFVVE